MDRLYECSLDGCDHRKFNKNDALTRHQLIRHPNDFPDIPWRTLGGVDRDVIIRVVQRSKDSFNRHQLRRHPNEFPDIPWIECPHTGCPFKTKCRNHKILHSNFRMAYECRHTGCQFKSKFKRSLNEHTKTCKPQMIGDSGQSRSLNTSTDAIPDIPWIECQRKDCQFRCKLRPDMSSHAKSHGKLLDIRECPQSRCGKWFMNQKALDVHMNTHTTNSPSKSTGASITDNECHNSYESSVETIGGSVDSKDDYCEDNCVEGVENNENLNEMNAEIMNVKHELIDGKVIELNANCNNNESIDRNSYEYNRKTDCNSDDKLIADL
ncbi:unnamed protein product [Oppiella nova]|uniref:C2H2-type domain-containing protein n=1 Tax=Oppiella nova TaxID=334625 RepID=A0A7R9M9J0_9ACAR|nr:unnamed protein product [Oppiella nova]CAG2173179.1 unnamed protein product [Oppiella nova]